MMGDYERLRVQVRAELKNPDLRRMSLLLADVIERMSNISSNGLPSGIHSFDKPELAHMLALVSNILKSKDVESAEPDVRCDICGRFVNRRYPVCSSWHDELSGDIIQEEVGYICS